MDSAKPSIVTQKVFQAASSSGPLNSTNCCAICQGLGKMNSGMRSPHDQLPQQQHRRQHDQRRPALDVLADLHGGLTRLGDGHHAGLADGADVAAQLVHDVGELGV
jgi:hypothetical protein